MRSLPYAALVTVAFALGCATAGETPVETDGGTTTPKDGSPPPATCDGPCDKDGDGVADPNDKCPNTPPKTPVNKAGCADSQLTPKLEPNFPPLGLTWTPSGNLGRAGGLTWSYAGINRGDLFHVYWIVCDDPATPCGLSLDGAIDVPAEKWQYSQPDSDLPNGKLVFTNKTAILLADNTSPALDGRLTITIVDDGNAPIPFLDVGTLTVPARDGKYGVEIKGTGYKVTAIAEVKDASSAWKPYLDYYDAAPTPDTGDAGGPVHVSFGASFYDK